MAGFSVSFLCAQAHKYIYTHIARKLLQRKTAGVHKERFMTWLQNKTITAVRNTWKESVKEGVNTHYI